MTHPLASGERGAMQKYAALISYVGTRYCGWQKQSGSAAEGALAIQAVFDEALRKITREPEARTVGSGRTDSGVHAVGQVVHFVLHQKRWDTQILRRAFNSLLPRDIQVLGVQEVPIEFHAQRSAEKKQYSYYFQQGATALPHFEPTSWWIRRSLNLEAMQKGLAFLKGEHDFKPFQASGSVELKSTVRQILEAEVTWNPIPYPGFFAGGFDGAPPFGLIRMRVVGTGFLKQMVRGIAGTLLQVGEERRPPEDFQRILETRDRQQVGPTAPARALWLERVWYPGLDWG